MAAISCATEKKVVRIRIKDVRRFSIQFWQCTRDRSYRLCMWFSCTTNILYIRVWEIFMRWALFGFERFYFHSCFCCVAAAVAVFIRRAFSWYLLRMKYEHEHKYFSLYLWHAKSQHKEYLRALHPDNGNEQQPKQPTNSAKQQQFSISLQNATPKITTKKSNE